MKISHSILVLIILLFGCRTAEIVKTNSDNAKVMNGSFNTKIALSLETRIFIEELNSEKLMTKKDAYSPSESLIKKYGLEKYNKGYKINGIVKVGEEFIQNEFNNLDIVMNATSNSIYTISIPLISLDKFLKINGIEYFEIAMKIEI